MRYAINIREDQLNPAGNAVRIARQSLSAAFKALYTPAFLYRPMGEQDPGYFGIAEPVGVHPDSRFEGASWLQLERRVTFRRSIDLEEIFWREVQKAPPHIYARTVRVMSGFEQDRVLELASTSAVIEGGIAEAGVSFVAPDTDAVISAPEMEISRRRKRKDIIRHEMLLAYGPRCAFTDEYHQSLDGLRYAVQGTFCRSGMVAPTICRTWFQ